MSQKLSLKDLQIAGKKVLMRVDFNVPLDDSRNITDDTRIQAAISSIQYILDKGGALILMSHLGRPKDTPTPKFSLAPCAKRLSELLDRDVLLAPDCIGYDTEMMCSLLEPGQVIMLENVRFHRGEKHPSEDPEFVHDLAKLGDCYVNDAFGSAHRKHASTYAVAKLFPDQAACGFLMEKEIEFLGNLLKNPKLPFYAIIGGAKISSKIGVLRALLHKVDALFIGGGMAYTFFKALGHEIGLSICEKQLVKEAKDILDVYEATGVKLYLPLDVVVADSISEDAQVEIVDIKEGIPSNFEGVDIGPKTRKLYEEALQKAKTILWNGPLGVFEVPQFAKGTEVIAHALGKIDATKVVGGGDSVAAIKAAHLTEAMTHLSTGGGASLEYLEKGRLPGIEALTNEKKKL